MKKHLITFAVGAGVVYAAGKLASRLQKPGADGKPPLGTTAAEYAPFLVGGAALVLAHHFLGNAA